MTCVLASQFDFPSNPCRLAGMSTTVVVPIFEDGLHTLVYAAGVAATEQSLRCPALGAILPTTPAILTMHAGRLAGGFAVG
jgi:hypothetical protein